MQAIDVMGFAGAFTCGVVQSGFELVGKRELTGAFGAPSCTANRAVLGDNWDLQVGDSYSWEPRNVELVFGNPPCSGFSLQSPAGTRGVDAKVNSCMWALSDYAAACRPDILIMESVRAAHAQGRELMLRLRANLEQKSGKQYTLHHVYHNAIELGGASKRPRYFMVCSAVPFGLEFPPIGQTATLGSVIGDLESLPLTWDEQPYQDGPTWWSHSARTWDGYVDGHEVLKANVYVRRCIELLEGIGWPQGATLSDVTRAYYNKFGDLPASWAPFKEKILRRDFAFGFRTNYMFRWYADRPAFVLNGMSMQNVLHPTQPRTLTHREALRIMGFPDSWRVSSLRDLTQLHRFWGKGVSVQCGRWIAGWAANSIAGAPGSISGELVGNREYMITPKMAGRSDLGMVPDATADEDEELSA